jgi:hypothetical protein
MMNRRYQLGIVSLGHAIWQSQEVSAGDEKYLGGSRGEQIHQSRSTQLSTQR